MLNKVVLAREALLADTIAAFKGTVKFAANVDRAVMEVEGPKGLEFR